MSQFSFVFQGGKYRTILIPDTAGNVAYTTGPSNVWLVLMGRIKLVAVGTASRYINFDIMEGANIITRLPVDAGAILAGQTKYYNYMPDIKCVGSGAGVLDLGQASADDLCHMSLGQTMLLNSDLDIRISILGGLAADTFSGRIRVLEIDEPT